MDRISSSQRSAVMRRVRSTDTRPEMLVRRLVHSLGYRYRLHSAGLPGRPDIVFPARRKVIFVHGCFWHSHPNPTCKRARLPKSRQDYWLPKLKRTVVRDAECLQALKAAGWEALVLWECGLGDIASLAITIQAFFGPSGQRA
ncbi:MAG: DNA mismatch endonuclease Vsr [Proteobacteria bacterium]|nr:DNA mismatch endonuclease Vsr [Pseudomonadota bacterium]